ncbi:OmpA family protein [Bacteroidota bacterium]
MRQVVYICLMLILNMAQTYSQDKGMFKKTFIDAEFFFMTEQYPEAVHLYEELLKIDPENANLHFLAGACYLSIYGEKKKAVLHLERAVQEMSPGYREGSYKERSAPRESLFALARAYHIEEEFDKAIEQYEHYRGIMIKKHFADIEYVNNQIKSCELAKSMVKRPLDVQFLRLGDEVNKFQENYNPVVSFDDSTLIYMTNRPFYKAIMMSRRIPGIGWTDPMVINDAIGSEGNCYPTSLSASGKELYLVKKDVYSSDIYISYRKGDRFTKMVPLNNHINSDYSETHACISFNGKFLYFTSDRPGGQGGLDIWLSETTKEGDWGEPVNLGPKVNSHYSEETPFLTGSGNKLYFSSQGWATMGGFDFFVAEKLPTIRIPADMNTESEDLRSNAAFDAGWSFPENLGYPVSTADDDLFYYPRKSGQGAYFSAIIDEISPIRSIYTLRIRGEEAQIAAIRQDKDERIDPLTLKTTTQSHDDRTDTSAVKDSIPGIEDLQAVTTPVLKPEDHIVLNSILFGFDSDALNETAKAEAERVFEVMNKNPEIRIQLTGNTDAVGADSYNLNLSERRARSVANYLINRGIASSRVKVTAAGETRPIAINKYEDGSDSPDGRKLNRHVSIKLENLDSENIHVENIFVPDHLRPKADQSFSILLVNSNVMLDTIPDRVAGEQTALIITDSAFLYIAGNFKHRTQAMQYLNEVIDIGYPDAGMLEQQDLERLIARLSEEGIVVSASYTIQIMALKNPVEISHFKPLQDIEMYAGKDGFHRYVYGEFNSINEALGRLPEIKLMGYKDAFIMSILRYERLSR